MIGGEYLDTTLILKFKKLLHANPTLMGKKG